MRIRSAALLLAAAPLPANAVSGTYCPAGETVEVSGLISEVATWDPALPEIILERSTGACAVDAIRVNGSVPDTCTEGRQVTGGGEVQQSRDGTWTWLDADEVRCD